MNYLNDLLNQLGTEGVFWGVRPLNLVLAGLVIMLGFISRGLIVYLFRQYLSRYVARTSAEWDDDLIRLLPTPLSWAVQIFIWFGAALLLELPTAPVDVETHVFQGLLMALAFTICWVCLCIIDVFSRLLARASSKTQSRLDDQLVPLARKSAKVMVVVTFSIMVIQNLGYSVTSLLASLGVGGLALALAAQDTVANVFGSVVVFTDRPFQMGDWIEVAGIEGTVEEVGFRTTRVRRFDKAMVTLPNQTFSSSPITNYSNRAIRRISMTIGVTYETTAEQMEKLLEDLRKLVTSHPGLDRGFSFVHFSEFADSSLNIRIYCFSASPVWLDFLKTRETLMLSIMRVVKDNGLEMAFPTRTVYFRDEKYASATPSDTSTLADANNGHISA